MKYFNMILVSFLLASCATPNDLLKKEPIAEYDSPKSIEQLSGCIGQGWATKTSAISNVPTESGTMISLTHPQAGTDATAALTKTLNGTHVHYAERIPSLSPKWMKDIVVNCK